MPAAPRRRVSLQPQVLEREPQRPLPLSSCSPRRQACAGAVAPSEVPACPARRSPPRRRTPWGPAPMSGYAKGDRCAGRLPLPRLLRKVLRPRCARPLARPLSRWATRPPAPASGSASNGRRSFLQRGPVVGTSSSATPRRPPTAQACPSSRGRRPSRPRGREVRPGCSHGGFRRSAGRNRRRRRRKARSLIRRWCAGG